MSYVQNLHYSRITDHNRHATTDALYDPLRKVLLRPHQVAQDRPFLNPAASQSRVTRDFAYISQNQAQQMREQLLIPVDKPLIPTYDLQKVRNSKFMVVDAKQYSVGAPISAQQMQRIRSQGLKQQRIVYDFGEQNVHINTNTNVIQPQVQVEQVRPIIRQTKVIREELRSTYQPQIVDENQYNLRDGNNNKGKYRYNLYSMLDQQVNGGGCGCPANQVIASRNQPQSIGWLK